MLIISAYAKIKVVKGFMISPFRIYAEVIASGEDVQQKQTLLTPELSGVAYTVLHSGFIYKQALTTTKMER